MEKRKISGKLIGIVAAATVALTAVIVILVIYFTGKDDSYRSIQIYEVEGNVSIEREKIGTLDAVENLYLESGDWIHVPENSYMRLKLDDDKYILVEENSVLSIVAEGTKEDSKTSIQLEKGAIVNEIQNKLSDDSSYEVNTPNSVMAVRGTIFRVEITIDENGEIYTKVTTFEGAVGTWLVMPDGTKIEKDVVVKGGKEVIIHMDVEKTEYLSEPKDIEYSTLTDLCLKFLKEIIENGTKLPGISIEDIEALINKRNQEPDEEPDASEEPVSSEEPKSSEELLSSEEPKSSEKPILSETPDSGETVEGGTTGEGSPNTSEAPAVYTVTFVYNGTVFGTQTVEEGQKAVIPKLAPAQTGAWDFDFSKEITGDITIEWK